jgi:hypothetical protein
MKFWLINIGLIIIVVVLAIVLLVVRDTNAPPPDAPEATLADNFEKFARRVRNYRDEDFDDPAAQFSVDVALPSEPLASRIAQMPSVEATTSTDGALARRTFASNKQLAKIVADYAAQEGLVLIWDLPQDFIVKAPFVIEGTIAHAVKHITSAVKNNFSEPIIAYTCPDKRTFVVTTVALHRESNYCFRL